MKKSDQEVINSKCRDDWGNLIYQWVHDERDREMLVVHLLDGKSISQISELFNLSTVQAQSRLAKAKKQLFKHI